MIGVIHLLVLWILQLIGVKTADGVVSALSCLVCTFPDLIPLGVNDKVVFFIYKASIFYFLRKKQRFLAISLLFLLRLTGKFYAIEVEEVKVSVS